MSPAIGKDELTKMINDVFSSKDQLEKENEKLEGEIKKIKKEKVKLDNNVFILNANKEKFEKENKDLKAQNGKIEEMGDADQIYLNAKTSYTKRLIAAIPEGRKENIKNPHKT